MKNQWVKDLVLLLSIALFGLLSLMLLLKNLFAQWLLQTNWIISPESVLSVQNVRPLEPNPEPSSLRIHSRETNTSASFETDLEEFPLPVAFEPPLSVREEIPLESAVEKPNQMTTSLYFIRLNFDGLMLLASRPRMIHYSNTPILETLNALMEGPTIEELSGNYLSLIPSEARILSLSVAGNLATLDMNEAFSFNSLGNEGIINQIKQIVYTLTEFKEIAEVQFLIEGKQMDFLSAEGLFIGKPIGRRDLN